MPLEPDEPEEPLEPEDPEEPDEPEEPLEPELDGGQLPDDCVAVQFFFASSSVYGYESPLCEEHLQRPPMQR